MSGFALSRKRRLLWCCLLGSIFLFGAQPALAVVCLNNQSALASAVGIASGQGLRLQFTIRNDPPQYCWKWQVKYAADASWTEDDDCEQVDSALEELIATWEDLDADPDSSISDPGDTGTFRFKARAWVPACNFYGQWSSWLDYTFTVPGADD